MTRQGMPNKNVGLFFRKALNPAPEVPHITFWMLDILIYIMNSLVEAPRPSGCQVRKPSKMCSARQETVTGAVQHQGVLNSLQLLHKMKSLKQTTSQKQTSEKGHAHFWDMFPDRCTWVFQFRCWKRLPLSPLVVLQSDWRRCCKNISLRNCWAHTSVCTHYYAVRLIKCDGGKKWIRHKAL